jgi:hypothetical protein
VRGAAPPFVGRVLPVVGRDYEQVGLVGRTRSADLALGGSPATEMGRTAGQRRSALATVVKE